MAEVIANGDTESVIDKFGKKYEAERNQWQTFLQYVHIKCEDSLRGRVQASVTSRVKYWDSLRKKLEKMNEKQNYRKVADIEADKKLDMAGVRIRAFFPKQLSEVYKIVEEIFDVKDIKQCERDWKDPDKLEIYEERFGNYEGCHYWVKLKTNDSEFLHTELRKRFKDQVIEIQVRSSMLLDSWAEVRHDFTYKALGRIPSRAEREVLDTMKGVVKSMEVLLDHLFDVHEDRVKSDDMKLEAMPILEQALVRALPQLSQSHERIENMPVLQTFLMASSIDTPAQVKRRIRKSKFPDEWIGFCESRELSKQPVWTFILERIFITLSGDELNEILSKILEKSKLDQVFYRSILWLEEYLFTKEHIQWKPLKPNKIKRCNMIWYVHEYISAPWPEHKPNLCSLLEDMLCYVKSPAPRVDTSLYVAIAETLSGIAYGLPETEILEKLRSPNLMRELRQWRLSGQWVSDTFRWHRHDSFRDHVNTSETLQKSVQNSSVEESCCSLLDIATSRLSGAMLHRAVSHSHKDKNVEAVKQLLEAHTDIDVNFVNGSGQSTLHAATIFSPNVETVKKILGSERVDVNKADKNGETALLAALILGKDDSLSCLLNEASINVNIRGGLSPESLAVYYWDASLHGYTDPFCNLYAPEAISCGRGLGCCSSIMREKTVAEYCALDLDWYELKRIVQNPSFTILDSFRDWRYFFQSTEHDVTFFGVKIYGDESRKIFLDYLKKDVNKLDKGCDRSLDIVLVCGLSDEKEWVKLLLDIGANASPTTAHRGTYTLVTSRNQESFRLVLESMSPPQLMVKDQYGRNALHLVAHQSPDRKLAALLSSGLNKYLTDIQGRTWTHHAVSSGLGYGLVGDCRHKYLIEFRKQCVAKDDDGWTPLHWLCFAHPRDARPTHPEEWKRRVEFLLENGADPDLPYLSKCRKLLPQSQNSPSLPQIIPRAFYGLEGNSSSKCHNCSSDSTPFIGYSKRGQFDQFFLCFKCGRTKEKTHPGEEFSEKGMHGIHKYLDNLDEEIRRASELSASASEKDDP